ncbi:MAG: carboxypeptidase-like regulatory domain-containing protein, partial [Candidatus Marinimicrobia bacterium]|nr:carboxypeptidase-like regulatory domain-containing protein [Candidatus Neomarinimicrobiota bacterium]
MNTNKNRTNRPGGIIMAVALIMFGLATSLSAATVSGKVTDAKSGDYLPGANVILVGTTNGAATDRAGDFYIANVPTGDYTLTVKYIGYEDYTLEITVSENNNDNYFTIAINVSSVKMEDVVVSGLRQGQAKALSQQKSADNIKSVVDEEQMKMFPDVNSAEVMQRIPGVSIARDQGEGRYVLVRGTSPRMNSTSIDGVKIPSGEGGDRSVMLDVISADNLSGIEVTKAITPDMDGDAIGGAVNLKTKSAMDYPG